jgi:hypothetical protein
MRAARLNLKLFVEGLEVPIIGCRCTYSEGGPATADVQVVATDEVFDLPPRALITIFYYEGNDLEKTSTGMSERLLSPNDPRRWKLLFMGELAGISLNKTSSSRSANLQCVDFTNYWDFIQQSYVNFRNGGIEMIENAFMGVRMDRQKFYDVTTKDVMSNLFVWLMNSKATDEDGKKTPSIFLGAHRLLREMYFASNFFYARAYNRLRIGDTLAGLKNDKTSQKLFRLEFFKKFVNNRIGGAGGLVTVRQMLGMLLEPVMHTYITVPCPKFDPKGESVGLTRKEMVAAHDLLEGEMVDYSAHNEAGLNLTVIKPDVWFVAPPACNVFYPDSYNSLQYQRNYLKEPTRLFMRTKLMFQSRASKWLTERLYAPDFTQLNALMKEEGGHLNSLSSVLLDYEDFQGINPTFVWQDDITAYVTGDARRTYLSFLADFIFWKYRFSTRTANLACHFNPDVLPGYPAAVFETVGPAGTKGRHLLGQIHTVVHSVTQKGGWTHATLIGCHHHTEDVDFDKKGRTLEEITNRGSDGFMDERYHADRIGQEVYQPLFGCDSIVDSVITQADDPTDSTVASTSEASNSIKAAVDYLEEIYRTARDGGMDMEAFIRSTTWRPKASLVDIHGIPDGLDAATSSHLADQGVEPRGFMGVASDVNDDTKGDYTSYKYVRGEDKTTTVVGEADDAQGLVDGSAAPKATETVVTPQYSKTGEKGAFDFKGHLEARQVSVLAYIESLKLRGLRG